jgi:hypothetical protein
MFVNKFSLNVLGADILRVCYFSGGSIYRDGHEHAMKIKDIDPFLCTHMIYASAALNDDGSGVKLPDGYEDFQQDVLYMFLALYNCIHTYLINFVY